MSTHYVLSLSRDKVSSKDAVSASAASSAAKAQAKAKPYPPSKPPSPISTTPTNPLETPAEIPRGLTGQNTPVPKSPTDVPPVPAGDVASPNPMSGQAAEPPNVEANGGRVLTRDGQVYAELNQDGSVTTGGVHSQHLSGETEADDDEGSEEPVVELFGGGDSDKEEEEEEDEEEEEIPETEPIQEPEQVDARANIARDAAKSLLKGKKDAPTVTQDVKGSGASRTERVDASTQQTAKPTVRTSQMQGNTPPPTPAMRELMLKLNSMEQNQRDYEEKILQACRTMTDMQSKIDAQAKVIDDHHV